MAFPTIVPTIVYVPNTPLEKSNFDQLEIPDLLINIWLYADQMSCSTCRQYCSWCIQCALDKWKDYFLSRDKKLY